MSGSNARRTDRVPAREVLDAIRRQQGQARRSALPEVSFTSTDRDQRLIWEAPNQFRIEGASRGGGACHVFTIDGQPLKVDLWPGEGPWSVAYRIRELLPEGYSVTLRAGHPPASYAVVSCWRRS
jgi:hypothetical protein